ncbi:MAG TPA: UDP-3-O-(3-hydroxymyristoyl)glucosamine N-acyltransferase [Candidatus Cloacimonadota bacterium]|nr:UDP-3-O-(3-hydroxymyristoyl)glucosamine N-acyltransferase [Candidatus Cloacimonadota bacterium]HPT72677.1 UDP-3-O-(3-hydroxymyristoyl)glucosamine N-acyltransferase [Candidatus Cloacimonadota bacterium]
MRKFQLVLSPELIASQVPSKLIKRCDAALSSVSDLSTADASSICFYENENFLEEAKKTQAGLLIVKDDFDPNILPNTNLLVVEKPYLIFMMVVKQWMSLDSQNFIPYIAPTAVISKTAKVSDKVRIGDYVVIGDNVEIGSETVIDANTVIMENSMIGKQCHFFPNVTIYPETTLKDRVILHAGVVIGADGFGYILYEGKQEKIPQLGNVVIEDDVEIGANSCIDRATLGTTYIGKHSKLDNLVQVGHNVQIGESSILCAQVGVAGSTEIGDVVYLAGQVGIADHVKIGNRVMAGAQSGIKGDVKDDDKVFGTPAIDARQQMRIVAVEKHLPEIWMEICKLKKERDK